ncbi:hypothetical protein WN944_018486 [Citrus x changshan-huyou]|uniref:Uncharacterized protein n=1 Tax=Citrus x changshan-huyou TaxID=2935761 RepID=A0AAP0LUH9_9ROSI
MNSEKKQQSQSNDQQQTLLVDDNNQRNDISETPSAKKSHFGSGSGFRQDLNLTPSQHDAIPRYLIPNPTCAIELALIMKRTEAVSIGACDQYNYVYT